MIQQNRREAFKQESPPLPVILSIILTFLMPVTGISTNAPGAVGAPTAGGAPADGVKFNTSSARIEPSGPVPLTNCNT